MLFILCQLYFPRHTTPGIFICYRCRTWKNSASPTYTPVRISSRYFFQHLWIEFGNFDQGLGCRAWFATPLLPILQGTHRDSQQRGKLVLRQASLFPRSHYWKSGNCVPASNPSSLDVLEPSQNLLPDITSLIPLRWFLFSCLAHLQLSLLWL